MKEAPVKGSDDTLASFSALMATTSLLLTLALTVAALW